MPLSQINSASIENASVAQVDLATGVAGTGPAFSAYASAATTIPNQIDTKVLFATEEFDTNNNFASSRFTPTVAGYYQISSSVYSVPATGSAYITIYKNGSGYKAGSLMPAISGLGAISTVSSIVYFNGSTDYVEIYLWQNSGTSSVTNVGSIVTWFNGAMVRGA